LKVNREVLKGLDVAERKLAATVESNYVLGDFNGLHHLDSTRGLTQIEFDVWVKQREMDLQIIIRDYSINGDETC
jgi:hypothetical protein